MIEPRNALVARADVLRWTEGYIAASERPWRRGPCRGRSAWHAGGWVSREPGRPHRLHLKGCRGAGTGSPSPRPWTWHLASDGANPQVLGWYRRAKANEARGDGRRGIGAPHTTGEAGESCPRNPVEGRGRREMDPLAGKTANTPRLESRLNVTTTDSRTGQTRTGDGMGHLHRILDQRVRDGA